MAASPSHPLVRLETLALIAIGGFVGANLRFLALGALSDIQAVLLVNVVGSFTLGLFAYEAEYVDILSRKSRLVFTTGVLSSLTTYSTFAIQTAIDAGPAEPLLLVGIVAGNYGLGFTGVLASRTVVRWLTTGPHPTGGETA
ncbi:chromosome condensation protein CrcB [Natronolimnobius sp. AArcel1]|uniref:fluoride efflux transporter FluC n=1 Tax=Natronolimnobius sp. AArcel1 TaxID=1679093 RepID=UPI0013EE14E1|nr:CrcB family protein [Natronolimnobius sp. AArcel1]NGM68398.1 chromosome condensation protein CrcB [Natronolimnobius sp. AArcel1]